MHRPALWRVVSNEARNHVGYATSYQFVSGHNVHTLLSEDDYPRRRAAFIDHHLWVARCSASTTPARAGAPRRCGRAPPPRRAACRNAATESTLALIPRFENGFIPRAIDRKRKRTGMFTSHYDQLPAAGRGAPDAL